MNLLFDYDGTLHDTAHIYIPAFRLAYHTLVQRGLAPDQDFTDDEIKGWLGYSPKEMWTTLLPDQPWSKLMDASAVVTVEMVRRIADGQARLFPGTEATLRQLKTDGHHLFFLSNCKKAYMKQHQSTFDLERYFEDFYCSEDYDYAPKYEIFLRIQKDHPGSYVIIGDRFHDLQIAEKYGLPAIACSYGYGREDEFSGANERIQDIRELPEAIGRLR
ncbi:MAG: HAD family hydrolase [Anaerovoracaceae bacterium]